MTLNVLRSSPSFPSSKTVQMYGLTNVSNSLSGVEDKGSDLTKVVVVWW